MRFLDAMPYVLLIFITFMVGVMKIIVTTITEFQITIYVIQE